MPKPVPERDLESQAHRETPELAEMREINASLENQLSTEEYDAFMAIVMPGITSEERDARITAFNELQAGIPKTDASATEVRETLADREHKEVSINFAGTHLKVSRSKRGAFTVSL